MTIGIAKLVFGTAALAMAAQASAAQNNVAYVCPSFDKRTGELSVRVDTGCKTGMARYNDNDLKLVMDQNYASIQVTGTINYNPIESMIVTADCAGAKQITLTASEVEARRYSVSYQGTHLGLSDLMENPQPNSCHSVIGTRSHIPQKVMFKSEFKDWSDEPIDGWRDWTGDNVFSLLSPILAGHPESTEGSPTLELKIEKAQWRGGWPGTREDSNLPFIGVRITRHGFLDDSVSGDRFFAQLRQTADGWEIENLWGQNMCGRGAHAGQWTKEICP